VKENSENQSKLTLMSSFFSSGDSGVKEAAIDFCENLVFFSWKNYSPEIGETSKLRK